MFPFPVNLPPTPSKKKEQLPLSFKCDLVVFFKKKNLNVSHADLKIDEGSRLTYPWSTGGDL